MKGVLIFVFICTSFVAHSQQIENSNVSLSKATITSIASISLNISNNNTRYNIAQSIGQSSIIGTTNTNNTTVQQGFLNNILFFKINNSESENFKETIRFTVSPNPFIDFVKVDFKVTTKAPIFIKVYDISGKVFFSKKYAPAKNLFVPLNRLSIGSYLIQIKTGNNSETEKIIKFEN